MDAHVSRLLEQAQEALNRSDLEEAGALTLAATELALQDQLPAAQVRALLLLHRVRHVAGDEDLARDLALHALKAAREHGLDELARQAEQSLLVLYAGAIALRPVAEITFQLR